MLHASDRLRPRCDRAPARPEYQALVDCYPELLRVFGVSLSAIDLADLSILIGAIEHVDRVIDAEPEASRRAVVMEALLALLEGDGVALEPALARTIRGLRQLAIRRGIHRALVALTAETLANTEQIRTARDREHYLACVEREGTLCNELSLLVVPLPAPAAAFLRAIAPTANLLDKLIDLRGDHQRREVIVDPGVRTHVALASRLFAGAWAASRVHPDRTEFLRWGLRWVRRMA